MGLLVEIGTPLLTTFETMLTTHDNQTEVTKLLKELKGAWKTSELAENAVEQMNIALTPLTNRAHSSTDFKLIEVYTRVGFVIGALDVYWKHVAMAFLLKEKLRTSSPTAIDIAMGGYFLSTDSFLQSEDTFVVNEFLSWSVAPEWKLITKETASPDLLLPEKWLNSFAVPEPITTPLPSLLFMEKSMQQSGTLGQIPQIVQEWNTYTRILVHYLQ